MACNTFERSSRRGSRAATLEVWVGRCPARENVFGPGVQVSQLLTNPQKMGCSSWKICLPIFQDRWTKRLLDKKCQLLVFLAGPTRPCQILLSPPSCKASLPFLKAAAATQRGMERKTCCSVSNNDKLCGQRQASAPEVWWCRIKSEFFFAIEGYSWWSFLYISTIILSHGTISYIYYLYLFVYAFKNSQPSNGFLDVFGNPKTTSEGFLQR